MRLETHYRETPSYLVAKISGSWMEQNAKDAIEEVSGEARRRGIDEGPSRFERTFRVRIRR